MFLLQASDGLDTVTLKLEKEQTRALAHAAQELIDSLEEQFPVEESPFDSPLSADMMLKNPLEPLFQIGQIGLGYDRGRDMVVIATQEFAMEGEEDPSSARFWISRPQLRHLGQHALEIVEQGRPVCPLCGRPMDATGHFCPRRNGHDKAYLQ
jgi:uncharacterized repeat protein (TIGR03847 family)